MSEWEAKEWIVVGLTAVTFLGIGIWCLLHYFWLGRRHRWPKGERRKITYEGYTVHVIAPNQAPSVALQSACAKAVAAAAQGWVLAGHNGPHAKIGEVAVWFRPDAEFDGLNERLRTAAAYLDRVPRAVGNRMPCAVIRTSLYAHVKEAGEPLIHEMMHALDDWDASHDDPQVWEATGYSKSAQDRAQRVYLRSIGQDGSEA